MRGKLVLALVGEWMATNKDSILVTNRDDLAQNKRWNKFVSKLMCTMLNRRTHQRTESLEIVFCLLWGDKKLPETTRKPGGFELCSAVPCCLHSCDQQLEYLVLRNNSFSAPHRCADREGQGVSWEGGGDKWRRELGERPARRRRRIKMERCEKEEDCPRD